MDRQNPLVSVIIPTYNRARYLREAMESVIAQTYKDWEIVIIDDGSTDNTKELVAEYIKRFNNIKYVYQNHKGLSEARNNGLLNAKGKYVAFIDDDDLWLNDKLKKQVRILEDNPDVGLVYSKILMVEEVTNRYEVLNSSIGKDTFQDLFDRSYVQISTVLVRKECFDNVGLFDKSLYSTQDYDMWLRVSKLYRHLGIDEALVKYRKHLTNMSSLNEIKYRDASRIIKKAYKDNQNLISLNHYRLRLARLHYKNATIFLDRRQYLKSMVEFFNAVIKHPFVGLNIDWGIKKPLIYNLSKPYLAIFFCLYKNCQCLFFAKNE